MLAGRFYAYPLTVLQRRSHCPFFHVMMAQLSNGTELPRVTQQ